jgi:hypothetical protein
MTVSVQTRRSAGGRWLVRDSPNSGHLPGVARRLHPTESEFRDKQGRKHCEGDEPACAYPLGSDLRSHGSTAGTDTRVPSKNSLGRSLGTESILRPSTAGSD